MKKSIPRTKKSSLKPHGMYGVIGRRAENNLAEFSTIYQSLHTFHVISDCSFLFLVLVSSLNVKSYLTHKNKDKKTVTLYIAVQLACISSNEICQNYDISYTFHKQIKIFLRNSKYYLLHM